MKLKLLLMESEDLNLTIQLKKMVKPSLSLLSMPRTDLSGSLLTLPA